VRASRPPAHLGGRDSRVGGWVGSSGDLAERVAGGREVDLGPVGVAERAADAFRGSLELGGYGDAVVTPSTTREILLRPGSRDTARERLALDAPDRAVERAAADTGTSVIQDRYGDLVQQGSARSESRIRTCARRCARGRTTEPWPLFELERSELALALLDPLAELASVPLLLGSCWASCAAGTSTMPAAIIASSAMPVAILRPRPMRRQARPGSSARLGIGS
jgi:hypothetical protein